LSRRRSRPYALTLRGLEARATRDLGPILTNDRDPDLASIPRESHSQQGLPSCCGCSVGQFFRSAGHAHRTPLRQNILSRPANLDGKGSIAGTATRQACAYRGAWRSLLGGLVIPTLVLVGLALGVLIHDGASLRRSRRRCSGVGALGCRRRIAAANALTTVGGVALGLANVVVRAAIGAAVSATWRVAGRVGHRRSPAQ
jgi:hypothetical protein